MARLYASLRRIRRAEEEIARIYPSDKIKSPVHLSLGQEAVSAGVIDVLREEDVVSGTYRGHAVYIAKGGSMRTMSAPRMKDESVGRILSESEPVMSS